jgi:hypothetical protein
MATLFTVGLVGLGAVLVCNPLSMLGFGTLGPVAGTSVNVSVSIRVLMG